VGTNSDGDGQKALDVVADRLFRGALAGAGVAWYASEEEEDVVALDPKGPFAIAIDPLDGSSNIDVDVSIGTIFSIYPAAVDGSSSFLRSVSDQLAAGYFIYGPQTSLVVGFGDGVQKYTLDLDIGRFVLTNPKLRVPERSNEYAINASNYRHWASPVRAYVDDLVAGSEGPHGKDFNMRWIASLVAEAHRILIRGGVFLYPSDDRKGYQQGRLRLLYECGPIAFLAVAAGGQQPTVSTPSSGGRSPASTSARR
jgi:fructose-1,6-bisphosphatase I